jgi:hypothetical protein
VDKSTLKVSITSNLVWESKKSLPIVNSDIFVQEAINMIPVTKIIGMIKEIPVNEKFCLPSFPSLIPFINLSVSANEYQNRL